ncbi:MAG: hypothetical protein R3F56_14290 [Planctomycetota bacterium]
MRNARNVDDGRLLQFLSAGLTHGLSNALFVISTHAKLLGGGETQIARERAAILRANGNAEGILDVVRFCLGEASERPAARQVGVLVRQVCELLRVSCREHGLRVKASHSSADSPANVDAVQLCRALVETVREVVDGLPSGYSGVLDVDVSAQARDGVVLSLSVAHDRDLLPFPLDLARIVAAARRSIEDPDVSLDRASQRQIRMRLPTVRELGPRAAVLAAAP